MHNFRVPVRRGDYKLCTVARNVYGALVRNLLHFTPLAPRILKLLLDFSKIDAPFFCGMLFCGSAKEESA